VLWSLECCEGLREILGGVSFHYSGGTVEETAIVKKRFPELELHFTEGGPRLTENYATDWCKWGLMIVKCLKVGYQSFTGWNVILNELGGPNVGPHIGICGGFVTLDNRTFELSYSGQYKAYAHVAPYVTSASKIRAITVDESCDLRMSRFPKHSMKIEGALIENPDGKRIAVLVNPNSNGVQTQLEIGGELYYLELLPDSLSTVIVG
jgi:O-glycosyl hydrolase